MTEIRPQSLYHSTGLIVPTLTTIKPNLIVNDHSSGALQAATEEVLDCFPSLTMRTVAESLAESTARRVFQLGEQDARGLSLPFES